MLPQEQCTGCAACAYVCPHNCITMQPDSKGFLCPSIDIVSCIKCGACEKVCPALSPVSKWSLPIKVYAARSRKTDERLNSSSSGIASVLAETYMQNGGIVYGAAFDANLNVKHIRVTDSEGVKKIQGSKYVQSDIQQIYPELKQDLKTGNSVLVFGTPCQIAALRKIFENQDKLLLCDLICHSAPSPKLFADHIRAIEADGKKVLDYRFRDKAFGWSYNLNRILYQDGSEELHSYWNQCYKRLFLLNLTERESCYSCPYANCRRVGDITLGDYWGIDKVTDQFADDQGVNVVLVNSEKATLILETALYQKTECVETALEDALQKHLIMPCEKSSLADSFWECYQKTSYRTAAERFAGGYHYLTWRNRLKDLLRKYRVLKRIRKQGKSL